MSSDSRWLPLFSFNKGVALVFVSAPQKQAPLLSAVFPIDAPNVARYPETSLYQPLDYSSSVCVRQLNQRVR